MRSARRANPALALLAIGTLALATLTGFVALSLLLTVLGIYGVLRYHVHQRTHEIGIRLAVGARPADVLRMVLRQGIEITAAGLALGIALALTRLLGGLLHGISPVDTGTFLAMIVLLSIIATAATVLPARRAASVDPLQSLRLD